MRFNGFFSGLCLSALFWAAPGLQADAGGRADWRPVPHALGGMPRALGQFRPQRVAAPRPVMPSYAGRETGRWGGQQQAPSGYHPAVPAYVPARSYPMPAQAWGQPYRPVPYAVPSPAYGFRPPSGQLAQRDLRPGAVAAPVYPAAGYATRSPMAPPAMPRRVTWNQPAVARFRPVADPRAWDQSPSWRSTGVPVYQQAGRYPARAVMVPAARLAPAPRAWQGKTVFRPVPVGQQSPQYAAQAWADPRFRPLPVQYQERRVAQDWRPADNATLPGWLSTESSTPAWQACGLCTGS